MLNALSIDLEDWFCAHNLQIKIEDWDRCELRIIPNTRRLLDLLHAHDVRATFFVLGWIAERVPGLVREIEFRGHEIGTHGYSHTLLTEMTPAAFEADLNRALEVTFACTSRPVRGFRAPSFTVTRSTLWALDILARYGLEYDSSIFPIDYHPDYGIPGAALSIHKIGPLVEVPLSVAEVRGKRVPCSGGGYFRVFPYWVTRWLMRQCHRQGRPIIFYLHPWEIDPGQPRVPMTRSKRFRHYHNLHRTLPRLSRLLREFKFAPIRDVLGL